MCQSRWLYNFNNFLSLWCFTRIFFLLDFLSLSVRRIPLSSASLLSFSPLLLMKYWSTLEYFCSQEKSLVLCSEVTFSWFSLTLAFIFFIPFFLSFTNETITGNFLARNRMKSGNNDRMPYLLMESKFNAWVKSGDSLDIPTSLLFVMREPTSRLHSLNIMMGMHRNHCLLSSYPLFTSLFFHSLMNILFHSK